MKTSFRVNFTYNGARTELLQGGEKCEQRRGRSAKMGARIGRVMTIIGFLGEGERGRDSMVGAREKGRVN